MSDQRYEIRELIDILPKAGVAFLAACYAIGFIIVNLHLAKFGITDLEVIKSKYIAAGLLYLFFMILTVGFLFFAIQLRHELKDAAKSLRGIIALFLIALWVFFVAPHLIIARVDWSTLLRYYCFLLLNTTLCFVFFITFAAELTVSPSARTLFLKILGMLLTLFLSSASFALLIYPKTCMHYGGGRLSQVQITYSDEKLPASLCRILSELPLETDLVSQDTETITLYMALDENKEIYDATVSLPRTAVKSIIFLGESPRASLRLKQRRDKNIYRIAQIFADVYDNTENPRHEEILKNKLKNINLNDNEIDFFVNLFREVATEVQKSLKTL